ncbi:MAG: hypothetical protein DDT32_01901 [Syntrophomonadaceae bacterium]|nr:hypothetical protein [Bacillota bacterium]MBT9148131.1 hypothetical protein [Bacillota bacterium]
MDDEKKWIDYGIAENLIRVLAKGNVLKLPTVPEETAVETTNAEDANGE